MLDLFTAFCPSDSSRCSSAVTPHQHAAPATFARVTLFLLIAVLVAGCASTNPRRSSGEFSTVNEPVFGSEYERERAFDKEFNDMIRQCQTVLQEHQQRSWSGAKKVFWLSAVGVIAGTVLAPALAAANAQANAAWIAGLSGLGGATGATALLLSQNALAGDAAANDRNAIVLRMRDRIEEALDSSRDIEQRYDSLRAAKAECIIHTITVPSTPSE